VKWRWANRGHARLVVSTHDQAHGRQQPENIHLPVDRKPDGHEYGSKFVSMGTDAGVILNPLNICRRIWKNNIGSRKATIHVLRADIWAPNTRIYTLMLGFHSHLILISFHLLDSYSQPPHTPDRPPYPVLQSSLCVTAPTSPICPCRCLTGCPPRDMPKVVNFGWGDAEIRNSKVQGTQDLNSFGPHGA
jgi:hypothetical protein